MDTNQCLTHDNLSSTMIILVEYNFNQKVLCLVTNGIYNVVHHSNTLQKTGNSRAEGDLSNGILMYSQFIFYTYL